MNGEELMYIEEEPSSHKSWRGSFAPVLQGTFFDRYLSYVIKKQLPYDNLPYYEVGYGSKVIYVQDVPDRWLEDEE